MGAAHDHGGHALRAGERHRGRLWAAVSLLAVLTVAEVVTALLTGSLALLSDAGHMFTDVLGISMALAAIGAASRAARPDGGDPQRTFGLYRLEVLAALANAVLLSGVAVYVLVAAVRRLDNPPEIVVGPMLAVAAGGLVANLVAFALVRAGAKESLNVRGAYLEVVADLLGSTGVLVAGAVIWLTGGWYVDPLVAVAVGLFILPRTWRLGRAAERIRVQAAPEHVDVTAVRARLAALPGVRDVHDLHVWTLASGMDVTSAHLTLDHRADVAAVLARARASLHEEFHIEHATLQMEPAEADGACQPVSW
jgi:cobalt-zinc-cadmium efflux system protein